MYSLAIDFHTVRLKDIILMKPQFKTLNMKTTLTGKITNKHGVFQGNFW